MRLLFHKMDPDTAYVASMLWLPKRRLHMEPIKSALGYFVSESVYKCSSCNRVPAEPDKKPEECSYCQGKSFRKESIARMTPLWEETEHHILVPREFLSTEAYKQFPFQFVDLTPKNFPPVGIRTNIVLRAERNQIEAYAAFKKAHSGVLNLAPGRGKTVLALKRLEDLGCPGLVVVHNGYLMDQWKKRIEQFVEFPVGEQLGIIQGPEFDWKRPLTLAMIQTLANRAEKGDLPPDFGSYFGAIFFDEVHHLSAPLFVQSAPLVNGHRYGLTATDKRTDGFEYVYQYHIGKVFYSDMVAEITPRVYFQQTPSWLDLDDETVKDCNGELHLGKLRGALVEDPAILQFRSEMMQDALSQGRKVLAVGHSKKVLVQLAEDFPGAGLIIQDTPQSERTGVVANSRIIFAINQLGIEGLDDDFIDALFFLTPFKNENDLVQAFGRIQRTYKGKKTPVVVIFDDVFIRPLHYLCEKLRKILVDKRIPYQTLDIPDRWKAVIPAGAGRRKR